MPTAANAQVDETAPIITEEAIAMDVPHLPEAEPEIDPADAVDLGADDDHEAAAAAAALAVQAVTEPITFDQHDAKSLLQSIRGLQEGQTQQTQIIQKLHKTVLNTRTIINELIVTQNELKDEIQKLKNSSTAGVAPSNPPTPATTTVAVAASNTHPATTTPSLPPPAPATPDDEIDAIIASRIRKSQWPVKHSTLNCFSVQQDLVKLRFHHSEKYQHIPVRIPKTDKNKDGTKPCKLCSEGKVRRKTTWMCATCEVPLCTRPLMGEDVMGGGVLTHHARWHTARDLVVEHAKVHAELKNGRESRKRTREERDSLGLSGVGVDEEEEGDGIADEEHHHHQVVHEEEVMINVNV